LFLLAVAALVVWKIEANRREADALTAKLDADANQAIPVTVAAVVAKPMPIYLTELGTVTAFNTVTVKSRVDGQLLSVNVREGQAVHQGELLALIDPRPYQAALDQARGQLVKDEAAADYAKAEAARYTALLEAGVVSKESQQTQISSAGQSAGALASDRAAIEAAKVNLVYTRIESPIAGMVGLRQVDAGNIVHATDANGLIVVTQLQPITVIFMLPEDQLPQVLKLLHTGRALEVEAFDRAQATRLATGKVLTVDNQIDTTTGTVKVKAVFPNADGALFPNQFVNVRLVLEQRPRSLVLPAAALQSGSNGDFVYVSRPCPAKGCPRPELGPGSDPASAPKDAKFYADIEPVAVDLTEGSQLILKPGVGLGPAPGEEVIVDGQEKLKRYSPIVPKAATHAEQGQ
jgi:multidrug efflux system membrane fusion protein